MSVKLLIGQLFPVPDAVKVRSGGASAKHDFLNRNCAPFSELQVIRFGQRRPAGVEARHAFVCASAILLFLLTPVFTRAQSDYSAEYPVKLAFLYNFTKFVEWPAEAYPSPEAPLNICLVGQDPFGYDIEHALRSRTVGNHPVALLKFKPGQNLKGCHVVFVSADSDKRSIAIVADLGSSDTLTVGESQDFARNGGMIRFMIEENKVRFEVNLEATKKTHLRISSELLALARIVKSVGTQSSGPPNPNPEKRSKTNPAALPR
jgi:hypothetical protein